MNALLRRLSRTGLRRGFAEGSGPWMTIGISAYLLRLASRALARANAPEVVYRAELRPGERLEITTSSRKEKRSRGA